jgi:hypothetical protein
LSIFEAARVFDSRSALHGMAVGHEVPRLAAIDRITGTVHRSHSGIRYEHC